MDRRRKVEFILIILIFSYSLFDTRVRDACMHTWIVIHFFTMCKASARTCKLNIPGLHFSLELLMTLGLFLNFLTPSFHRSKSAGDIQVDPAIIRQIRYEELQKYREQIKDSENKWQDVSITTLTLQDICLLPPVLNIWMKTSRHRSKRWAQDLRDLCGSRESRCCGAAAGWKESCLDRRQRRRQTLIGAALPSGYGLSSFPYQCLCQETPRPAHTNHIMNLKWCNMDRWCNTETPELN